MRACSHRPPCPGCPRWDEPELPVRAQEVYAALCARSGLPAPRFHLGPPRGFRMRARLSVRGRAASPKIGIFQQGSHRIVDIPRCEIHHPRINEVVARVKQAIRTTGTAPYVEGPQKGLLRGIQIVIERASERAQLVLVAHSDDPEDLSPLIEALRADEETLLHSLWWNGNPTRHNHFLGPHWRHLFGPEATHEEIAGASVFYPPGAFGQSHLELSETLIAELSRHVPDGARVREFYAGTGAIGLGLADRVDSLVLNEIGEDSLRGLAMGIDALPDEAAGRCRVVPGDAASAVALLEDADTVIVDPPRKGLDPKLSEALLEHAPERLLYVSCGIESFARDSAALLDSKRYALRHLSAWALFRHSDHVETLACFERCPDAGGVR